MSKINRKLHRYLREPEKWDRRFLGKVKDFESKEESRREQKHLKAYLKGDTHYRDGYTEQKNPLLGIMQTVPNYVPVNQYLEKL